MRSAVSRYRIMNCGHTGNAGLPLFCLRSTTALRYNISRSFCLRLSTGFHCHLSPYLRCVNQAALGPGASRRIRAHGLRDRIHRAHARKTDGRRACARSLRFPDDISAFKRGVIGLWTGFPPTVTDSHTCARIHPHTLTHTHRHI